jgi:O-antigen ligase
LASAIQLGGAVLVVALAVLMVRPQWRLPALAFGLLAIPGNVDDRLPQMLLDPHDLANATAPAVSVVDLLMAWATILSLVERRRPGMILRRLILGAIVLWIVASASALVALANGVEPAAVLRGIVVFGRIPVLLYLAGALAPEIGDGSAIALAVVGGGVVLVGNGLYTTLMNGTDRFTASTFGRNGFAIVLVLATLISAGLAFRSWSWLRPRSRASIVPVGAAIVAATCLFGSAATGTRMSLVVLAAACVVAILAHPAPRTRAAVTRMGVIMLVMVVVLGSSAVLTSAGLRTISLVTRPGTTVDAVIEPDTVAEGSEVRSRNAFWSLAIQMTRERPITGVGPFQWNIQRYVLDPKSPKVVADSHNAYLQIAAEYGVPALTVYLALLVSALLLVVRGTWRGRLARREGWAAVSISVAALVYPLGELTNSHLFNVRNGAFGWLLIAVAVALTTGGLARGDREDRLPA